MPRPMGRTFKYVLVVRTDRTVRVARRPHLAIDEVGIDIYITFPGGWGQTVGRVNITAPEFTPTIEYREEPSDERTTSPTDTGGAMPALREPPLEH